MDKTSALLPDVSLQEHQKKVLNKLRDHPINVLLYHDLGSGKSLSSIAAAEQAGQPYTAVVPAALRQNFINEQDKFTDKETPSSVLSYSELARDKLIPHPETLIFDEAHRLRNQESKQTSNAITAADKAQNTILLSGTPVVNDPADFASMMSMLTKKHITPEEFRARYVKEHEVDPGLIKRILGYTPGVEEGLANEDELRHLLAGHVDYYKPDKSVVPVQYEDIPVEMSSEQAQLYQAMWNKLPWILKWKLKWQFPLNHNELTRMTSFLTGPRQVGLSTLPFMRANANAYKAFQQSPKLQKAVELLKDQLKDPRAKALVFSNFIDAGLTPYAAALDKAKIPNRIFDGTLSDVQRKKLVDDYNSNKIRAVLLGPSGTEGLSFKGTQAIQLLDPHFNAVRGRQAIGRGLRYDSHFDLPDDLKNVRVQRFISRLPLGLKDRLLSMVGFDREAERLAADDHLTQMALRKDKLNHQFLDLLKDIGSQ